MKPQSEVNEESLADFLAYLAGQHFAAGPSEWLRATRLFRAANGKFAPERWKTLLCPIFTRDAGEQERFYQAFDLYFREEAPPPAPVGLAPSQPRLENPSRLALPRRKVVRRASLAAACALSLALAAWFYFRGSEQFARLLAPALLNPPGAGMTQSAPQSPIMKWVEKKTKQLKSEPCAGWECVVQGKRPLVIGSPILLWAVYTWMLYPIHRRFRLRRMEDVLVPPFSVPLSLGRLRLPRGESFFLTARLLRKRLMGDIERLDIPATLLATTRRAGFPTLRFRTERRAPEYLLLVEQVSPRDHMAAWLDALAREFRKEGVLMQVYFFSGDPRSCYEKPGGARRTLTQLAADFRDQRLLLVCDGWELLDAETGIPAPWTRYFRQWENRALLTMRPSQEWGIPEVQLQHLFVTRPLGFNSLAELTGGFDSALRSRGAAPPASGEFDYPPPPEDLLASPAEGAVALLSMFFDPLVFAWLCACAVHSEIEWEWTLQLAAIVDGSGGLLAEANLLALIRLPWFRRGAIPGRWRTLLIAAMDKGLKKRVRAALLERLEKVQAPEGSFARRKQAIEIAAQRYWLRPDAKTRATLEIAMEQAPDADIEADETLVELRASWRLGAAGSGERSGFGNWVERLRQSGYRAATAAMLLVVIATLICRAVPVQREVESVLRYQVPETQPLARTEPGTSRNPEPPVPMKRPTIRLRQFSPPAITAARKTGPDLAVETPPELPPRAELQAAGLSPSPVNLPPPPAPPTVPKLPTYAVTKTGGSIVVRAITMAGSPMLEPAQVDLTSPKSGQYFSRGVLFGETEYAAIEFTGVPEGDYVLRIRPASSPEQSRSFAFSPGAGPVQLTFAFGRTIAPGSVRGIRAPDYENLPGDLKTLLALGLDRRAPFGKQLYDGLQDALKASLLNVYAKARATSIGQRTPWDFLTDLMELRTNIVLALAKADLPDALKASNTYRAVSPPSLPTVPKFQVLAKYQSRDLSPTLQLTISKDTEGRTLVAFEMAPGTQSNPRVTSSTDPYLVQGLLLKNGIDPLYYLVETPLRLQVIEGDPNAIKKRNPTVRVPKK